MPSPPPRRSAAICVVLVAGRTAVRPPKPRPQIPGVAKVLLADDAAYANRLAENLAKLARGAGSGSYSHIVAAATSSGKNFMPRVAALLDVAQISDISAVESPDTFVRPIYAGNAIATVQSADKIKVVTVRTTGFDAAPATGGSAADRGDRRRAARRGFPASSARS